jgi:hypothetical protein
MVRNLLSRWARNPFAMEGAMLRRGLATRLARAGPTEPANALPQAFRLPRASRVAGLATDETHRDHEERKVCHIEERDEKEGDNAETKG